MAGGWGLFTVSFFISQSNDFKDPLHLPLIGGENCLYKKAPAKWPGQCVKLFTSFVHKHAPAQGG